MLPSSHPNRIPHNKSLGNLSGAGAMPHIPSFDEVSNLIDLPTDLENCQRTGCMAAFSRLEDFENYFHEIMEIFDESTPSAGGTPEDSADSDSDHEADADAAAAAAAAANLSNSFSDIKSFMKNDKNRVNQSDKYHEIDQ